MARPSIEKNIDLGLLSVNNAATLSGLPATKIRLLVEQGTLGHFKVPGTIRNEIRISAADLLKVVREFQMPVSSRLEEAAANFQRKYKSSKHFTKPSE